MRVSDQDSVNLTKSIFWEPFVCSSQERLAHINDASKHNLAPSKIELKTNTYIVLSLIFNNADVFLRMLRFPFGVRVDIHVSHGARSGGAVKQSISGTLDEVPVPRKTHSSAASLTLLCASRWETAIEDIGRTGEQIYRLNFPTVVKL